MKNYLPKKLNTTPQKPSNQLNFRSNFSSTSTENSKISLLMIKNLSIITIIQILYRKPKRYMLISYQDYANFIYQEIFMVIEYRYDK